MSPWWPSEDHFLDALTSQAAAAFLTKMNKVVSEKGLEQMAHALLWKR